MGSTLKTTGEHIACDDTLPVFVKGAYNLGPVYENREVETAAIHPGEGIEHDKGAGGEDSYTLHTDGSVTAYGLAEIDFAQIALCSTDYAVGDDIPGLAYHLNPGAYVRNVVCVDPVSQNVEPDVPLTTASGTAGAFLAVIEPTLATEADNLGFNAAASVGGATANGTTILSRCHIRQAYYLADPSLAYDTVGYIWFGD